ncbi:hypothetical protein [Pseudosporangium ferrugineum]|uniref:LPXTG-motif cell wall-anchored protein n=1 Tax=Pseudosporangium ferrugineum TaxID=439699 RepID=A0A2T0S3A5_9ACTN|nr:hypothetical protein [Pseudosporangium ferrugineum]PRY27916.1 hypothetical protein CLV70_10970 [Pseudosporangium ferrugineum]
MRALRGFLVICAALCAIFLGSTAAQADPYPVGPPAAGVSDGSVSTGSSVRFSGRGFGAGELVRITVNGKVVGTVRASADGTFSTVVKLAGLDGDVVLSAAGVESGVVVNANVRVNAGESGGGGEDADDVNAGDALPTTGPSIGDLAKYVYGGTAAIMLGTGLLWFTRRRRASV